MKDYTASGIITMKDTCGIVYSICRLDYTLHKNGDFEYTFTPDYDMIDILPPEFQGIPGLDLSIRKEKYVRKNIVPVFISERTPPENRMDLQVLLSEVGMDYLDPMEWLLRTKRRYGGDNLHMIRVPDNLKPAIFDDVPCESYQFCRSVLASIAEGRKVVVDGMEITGENRLPVCNLLRSTISSELKYKSKHKTEKNRDLGRRPIEIGEIDLETMKSYVSQKICSADEAAKELGISRATLYRRFKDLDIKQKEPVSENAQ